MTSYSKEQLLEVASEVRDQCHCVSIGGIAVNLGLSRTDASQLLRKVASDPSRSYRATYCTVQEETVDQDTPCTVFKLSHREHVTPENHNFLYGLAVDSTDESLSTAHERDMARLDDMCRDGQYQTIRSPKLVIRPSERIRQQQQQEVAKDEGNADPVKTLVPSMAAPKKNVTAQQFFATSNNNQKTTQDEKENNSNEKVGNADDFVGDLDEDDDEEEEKDEKMEEAHVVRKHKTTANKRRAIEDNEDEDEPSPQQTEPVQKNPSKKQVLHGAMDDFATRKETTQHEASQENKKPRRKVLKEKTTMDSKGYLHTETKEVWEDIPSEEQEEPTVQKKQPLKKKPTGVKGNNTMKQGSLMGFFAKKK